VVVVVLEVLVADVMSMTSVVPVVAERVADMP